MCYVWCYAWCSRHLYFVWSLFLPIFFEVLCGVYFFSCMKHYVEFISLISIKFFMEVIILGVLLFPLLSVSDNMVKLLFVRYFLLKNIFEVVLKMCLFLHEVFILKYDFEGSLFLFPPTHIDFLDKDCFSQNLPNGEIVGFLIMCWLHFVKTRISSMMLYRCPRHASTTS